MRDENDTEEDHFDEGRGGPGHAVDKDAQGTQNDNPMT